MHINIFTRSFSQNFTKSLGISLGLITALLLTSCTKAETDTESDTAYSAEYTFLGSTSLEGGGETLFRSTQIAADGTIYCSLYSYEEQTQNSLEKILAFSAEGTFLREITLPLGNTRDSVKWYVDGNQNIYLAARENAEVSQTSDVPLRLYKFDAEGELCYYREFTELLGHIVQDIYVNDLCADRDGQVYLLLPDTVLLFKADGSFHGSIESRQSSPQSFVTGTDDTVYILCQNKSGGYELARIGYADKKASVIYGTLPELDHSRAAACKETQFLFSTAAGPCLYQGETGEQTLLFSWLEHNLLSASVRNLHMNEEGILILLANESQNGSQTTQLMRFAPKDTAQASAEVQASFEARESSTSEDQKTVLTLAAIHLSYYEQEAIVNFNHSNEQYRIEAVEYLPGNASYTGQDYADAYAKLEMEMALDSKGYDIISLNNLNVANLAEKGMFEDLYPYLDNSSVFDREDFFKSILDAYTMNDNLISIPDKVRINVIIGKKSDFGDRHGWTLRELLDYGKAHPEAPRLFATEHQDSVASVLLSYGTDSFARMENNVVSFDRETCRDVLELLKAHEDTTFETSRAGRLKQGKSLLISSIISDFESPQYIRALFDEPVTYLGYPDPEGNCCLFYTGQTEYAINSQSDCKEGAWEYIEFFLNNPTFDSNIPSQKSDFEEMAERQIAEQYIRDAEGNIALDENGNPRLSSSRTSHEDGSEESWSFTYGPITQEDVDWVREILESGGRAWHTSDNTVLYQATLEEGAPYFSEQKPIDVVVDILENRITLYLSE